MHGFSFREKDTCQINEGTTSYVGENEIFLGKHPMVANDSAVLKACGLITHETHKNGEGYNLIHRAKKEIESVFRIRE